MPTESLSRRSTLARHEKRDTRRAIVPLLVVSIVGSSYPAIAADVTPPSVSVIAPTIAESSSQPYTLKIADDIELAYRIVRTATTTPAVGPGGYAPYASQSVATLPYAMGVKSVSESLTLQVPIDGSVSQLVMVADTSGNVSKMEFTLAPPPTGLKFGEYPIIGNNLVPNNFDCASPALGWPSYVGGAQATTLQVLPGFPWSIASGYSPYVRLGFITAQYHSVDGFSLRSDGAIPLSATSFSMIGSFGGGSSGNVRVETKLKAQLRAQPVSKGGGQQFVIAITESCSVNGGPWIDGATATFAAQ